MSNITIPATRQLDAGSPIVSSPVQQVLAIGASGVASAAVNAATSAVLLSATIGCWVQISSAPTAVAGAAGNFYVPAGVMPVAIAVAPGSKVAVIQATAAGSLSIIEIG